MSGRVHVSTDDIRARGARRPAPPHHHELRRACRRPDAGHTAEQDCLQRDSCRLVDVQAKEQFPVWPNEPLIDQALLEKLERLTLHWQKSFPGLVGGRNASRFSGPARSSWITAISITAMISAPSTGAPICGSRSCFLKMFQVEPRIPVRILIDTSESMGTGDSAKVRLRAKTRSGPHLRWTGAAGHRLPAGICVIRSAGPATAAGGRHRFLPAVHFLNDLKLSGQSNFLQVARQFSFELSAARTGCRHLGFPR